MIRKIKRFIRGHISNRYGKAAFLDSCVPGARVLDVGCGNDSPAMFKALRPDIYYVGLDIGDYNQAHDPNQHADEYILVPPDRFADKIAEMPASFDAVVSAHNLEHCDAPQQALVSMLHALKPGGRLFLAFPSEASTRFPSRAGTLNFFDDATHVDLPKFDDILLTIKREGYGIDAAIRRYRPLHRLLIGFLQEPISRQQKRVMYGTWALYGFEAIIWVTRPRPSRNE